MHENTDSRCTTTVCELRAPLSRSGLSRFLLPTFLCGMQRKVGAAPHRGNANRPLAIQGKAKAPGKQTKRQPNSTTTITPSETNDARTENPSKAANHNVHQRRKNLKRRRQSLPHLQPIDRRRTSPPPRRIRIRHRPRGQNLKSSLRVRHLAQNTASRSRTSDAKTSRPGRTTH